MKLYLYNLLIGLDQFCNVLLGGAPDRTISYRVYYHRDHWAAAGYPSSFQPEGIAFVNWWAGCWETAHTIMAECIAGTRSIPTVEEFLAEMPALVLP